MVRVNGISLGPIDIPLEFVAYGAKANNTELNKPYVKAASVGVPMKRTGKPMKLRQPYCF